MNPTILLFQLRRERILLPVWVVGITALFAASGLAITREFGEEAERTAIVALAAGNPAFLFLRGLPDGTGLGALTFFQTFSFLAVLIGLMNVFLITRHTRADEDSGRSELLLAAPIGRTTTLRGVLAIAFAADLAVGVLTTCTGLLVGMNAGGALLTGAALGSVGLAFGGVAALCAQIMPTSRGANGLGAAAVGCAYLVRGVGDALGNATALTHVDPSWVSFLSVIGWAQATRPFSQANTLPLLVPLLVGVAAALAAVLVRRRRDLGASLFGQRLGRPRWHGAGPWGLAIRNQLGTTIGWSIGATILGLLAGVLSPFVLEAVGSNDELAALIRRLAPQLDVDTGELFAIALLGISATLAAAAGVQAMLRLRVDEADGRAEMFLAGRLSRTGWLVRQFAIAASSTVAVTTVGGLAAGLGFALAGQGATRVGSSLATAVVHLPAAMVFIALTALTFAWMPRLTAAAGWGLLVLGLVVGQLGDLLGLPRWVQSISPFRHIPAVPIEAVDPVPLIVMTISGLAVAAIASIGLRRRDIPA